ncbi:rod shape-determining protein MreC [Aromatoleum bremense]|uniref:Cell shape-determining protein MreC n=1 Tax=Aromatoleum bremense TaxID=76115 RepID=A0ABX1NPR5_9RHOO|nr:rod shape-determining protein MreC [Aromatoleum bremense]NMG13964.1 rod shape-determining protein MreC [Aromatoleum bremense]QTQ31860.1 Cell shape-determining protein [Aromatoleum bremense]
MSLAGHQSPPVFKQGPTPLVRLLVLVSVCLAMLVADLRFRYLEVVRQGLSVATWPLQMAAAAPVDFVRDAAVYFATLVEVQQDNAELRRSQLDAAQRLLRFEQLERDNAQLRELLQMAPAPGVRSVAAEVLYDAPDPFSRKVILDRGSQHGVAAGMAVVNAQGMIGQVTRAYPVQAEVTLLTDKDQAVPVQVARNGLRGVLFGAGLGRMELRFTLSGVDVLPGDRLETSGLDGIFLAGLPVAEVVSVDRESQTFAVVLCDPVAAVERTTQVLVLGRAEAPPSRPQPQPQSPALRRPERKG